MTRAPKPLPAFVQQEVLRGLQKLVALRLQGAPPEEGIKLTAAVWLEAMAALPIGWDKQQDAGRITAAFAQLAVDAERWPPPKMLIERLPKRPPLPQLAYDRTPTPEERARAQENLRKIKQSIKDIVQKKGA